MKHILTYRLFESSSSLTEDQINWLNQNTRGRWSVNPEGKIDVEGDFLGKYKEMTDFKGLKFGRVTGNFRCDGNDLTSLEGAPSTVGGNFVCQHNDLTSLEGAPSTVGGNFLCYKNDLTSLEGGPEEVGGKYDCTPNDKLVSLKGAPEILKGSFKGPGEIWIPPGNWSPDGILKALKETEDPRGKTLLATLLTKEDLQKKIDADPAAALADLKNHFSEPWFRELDLKWPGKMGPWVDLMGDAGELGF